MTEDMRLKSVVVKGPKVGVIPCLKTCDKAKKCPCDELQKYLGNKDTSDISCLEMEWIHVPTWKDAAFWIKLVFPIIVTALLVVLVFAKLGNFFRPTTGVKVTLVENGCSVECWTESAESFEQSTNDISRIKKDLQFLNGGK